MLDLFRQKGLTSIVYGAIVVGMILVFVLGFNPTQGKKLGSINQSCAARVHGSCIEPKAHRAAYRLLFSRGAGNMRPATASRIVLEGLIERELLAEEAARVGLLASEDEITDSIYHGWILVSLPADNAPLQRQLGFDEGRVKVDFFKDKQTKQFDLKTYERMVKQMTGRSPVEFHEWQAREILAAKMRDLVRAPIRVADQEAFDRYASERTTTTVSYAVIRRAWVEKYGISFEPKDIEAWGKDKENLKKVKASVRHILVKVDKPEEKEAKKKQAEELTERLKKGEDFAKLAKEFSADPGSKDKGGQYAGSQVEGFVEEFKKAYAELQPGEMTKSPVETSFGFHIIKKDPITKEDIAADYKDARSVAVAQEMIAKITADIRKGMSGDDAVKAAVTQFGKYQPQKPKPTAPSGDAGAEAGAGDAGAAPPPAAEEPADKAGDRPQWLTGSPANRDGDPIPAISSEASKEVTKFAFAAKEGDVSEQIQTGDGLMIVSLKERKPATKADYEKERDTYQQQLLLIKQAEALAHYVRRLRESAKADIKIDETNVIGAKSDAGASPSSDDEGEGN